TLTPSDHAVRATPDSGAIGLSGRQGPDRQGVHRPFQLLAEQAVDGALTLQPPLPLEGRRHHRYVEMALAAGVAVDAAFVVMAGVAPAVVLDLQPHRRQGCGQFFANYRRDRAFRHVMSLLATNSPLHFVRCHPPFNTSRASRTCGSSRPAPKRRRPKPTCSTSSRARSRASGRTAARPPLPALPSRASG